MLAAHLLTFARELRRAGFRLSAGDVATGLTALTKIDLADRREAALALRSVFAKSLEEQRRFDLLFDLYWDARAPEAGRAREAPARQPPTGRGGIGPRDAAEEPEGETRTAIYSPHEAVQDKDVSQASADELEELEALVARLARRLATRLSRHMRLSLRASSRLALRQMFRKNLGYGAEPLKLLFRRPSRRKADLVFLFDVSGSMARYSRFLLQLALVFVRQPRLRTEVFGFATELYRLSATLRQQEAQGALAAAQAAMPGRAGGTKIGASLEQFLRGYGGLMDSRTVVIIASDGWDTGELELLESAVRTIRRRCRGIIWLNPLAGRPGFEPSAAGMKAALPHIDVLAPAHSVASLRLLERYLARLGLR